MTEEELAEFIREDLETMNMIETHSDGTVIPYTNCIKFDNETMRNDNRKINELQDLTILKSLDELIRQQDRIIDEQKDVLVDIKKKMDFFGDFISEYQNGNCPLDSESYLQLIKQKRMETNNIIQKMERIMDKVNDIDMFVATHKDLKRSYKRRFSHKK